MDARLPEPPPAGEPGGRIQGFTEEDQRGVFFRDNPGCRKEQSFQG